MCCGLELHCHLVIRNHPPPTCPLFLAEIQHCLVTAGDVGCGVFECFENNSCEIRGLQEICMTFLHNAGKFDSQVGQGVFCNHKKTTKKTTPYPVLPSLCSRQQTDLLSSASFLDINLSNFLEGRSSIHAFHNLLSSPGILASLWPVRVPDHGSRGGWPQAQLAPIS